jgi:hypothetical protein
MAIWEFNAGLKSRHMGIKHKRRSLDEVLFENEYLLVLAYLVYLFFSLSFLTLKILKNRIFCLLK